MSGNQLRQTIVQSLAPVDALVILFLVLVALFSAALGYLIQSWPWLVSANVVSIVLIVFVAIRTREPRHRIANFLHTWYPVPAIFFMFKEIYILIQQLGLKDWDRLLIECDRFLFHVDPTVWLAHYSTPVITEILQLAYVSYYFLMITLGVELYLRKDRERFSFAVFTITYGFILSYIGYCVFPAVGPRFTLHDFAALDRELPGLFFTEPFRALINSGESIPQNVLNPIASAQRDAFPSGHTQMALIVMYLAHRYHLRARWWLYVFGTLLIISTVYLRYHYVTDLAGGLLFMIFTVWTAPKLVAWWRGRVQRQTVPVQSSGAVGG